MNNLAADKAACWTATGLVKAFSFVTTTLINKYCCNFFHGPLDLRENANLISRLDVSDVFFFAFKVSVLLTAKLFSSSKQSPVVFPRNNILFNILHSIWWIETFISFLILKCVFSVKAGHSNCDVPYNTRKNVWIKQVKTKKDLHCHLCL